MLQIDSSIMITGAAGFIGSCMSSFLNEKGHKNLILVDDFSKESKFANFSTIEYIAKIERDQLSSFLQKKNKIDFVIHFGARTDTTEMDYTIHEKLNLQSSIELWNYCAEHQIPFIYASSAATYGNGEFGYTDDHNIIEKLNPLNPYGVSKNEFDKFAIQLAKEKGDDHLCPQHWYGLKFFNVYGPNEYHKDRMASVIFHAFHQIKKDGKLRLFRSHNPNYIDGGQLRDFIYVKDVLKVTYWLMNNLPHCGIYNLGTGKASTFIALADAVFEAMNISPQIEFIETPLDIREKYQYFTEANMQKIKNEGYTDDFYSIKEGVKDYILNYLANENNYNQSKLL